MRLPRASDRRDHPGPGHAQELKLKIAQAWLRAIRASCAWSLTDRATPPTATADKTAEIAPYVCPMLLRSGQSASEGASRWITNGERNTPAVVAARIIATPRM